MDLAFITPTAYLERYSKQGDIYLALAHLVDDAGENEYARFHRRESEQGKRVILDNGLFEGAQVSAESLVERARAIKASVVCAPDVLYDADATIKEFKKFVRLCQDTGLCIQLMGIPQADNPTDYWECLRFFDMHASCDIIGLSILAVPKSFNELAREPGITSSRMHLLEQLYSQQKLFSRGHTPMHLLGLGDSLGDVILASRLLSDTVVSNDSSSAFVHGRQGVRYTVFGSVPGGKDHTKLDFDMPWSEDPLDVDHTAIQYNVSSALRLAHTRWH